MRIYQDIANMNVHQYTIFQIDAEMETSSGLMCTHNSPSKSDTFQNLILHYKLYSITKIANERCGMTSYIYCCGHKPFCIYVMKNYVIMIISVNNTLFHHHTGYN